MTVTWDDSARLEGGPNVLGDLLVRDILADLASHLLDPSQDLLVGKTGTTLATIGRQNTHPWRGPARPLRAAENDRKGSERAEPTK